MPPSFNHVLLNSIVFVNSDSCHLIRCQIKARDLKWRHVGGGSTEKIMKRYLWSDIDENALLGLGKY